MYIINPEFTGKALNMIEMMDVSQTPRSTRTLPAALELFPTIACQTAFSAPTTSLLRTPLLLHIFLPIIKTQMTKLASRISRLSTTKPGDSPSPCPLPTERCRRANRNASIRARNFVVLARGASATDHKPMCSQSKYSTSNSVSHVHRLEPPLPWNEPNGEACPGSPLPPNDVREFPTKGDEPVPVRASSNSIRSCSALRCVCKFSTAITSGERPLNSVTPEPKTPESIL